MRQLLLVLLLLPLLAWAGPKEELNRAFEAYKRGDHATAAQRFQTLAEQGNAAAQTRLGNMHFLGQGVSRDLKQAEQWFLRAAEQDDVDAAFNLGHLYSQDWRNKSGRTVFLHNVFESRKWYTRAAELGHVHAQFIVATKVKTEQWLGDSEEIMKWYRRAADQGYAPAQFQLGFIYGFRDKTEAAKWFRRAAETRRLLYGSQLERKAIARAQYELGFYYIFGDGGLARDYVSAYAWLDASSKNGYRPVSHYEDLVGYTAPYYKIDIEAERETEKIFGKKVFWKKPWRELIEPSMTPQQIEQGQKLARELLAKYGTK